MSRRLDFERDGRDWPNRQASRFIEADGVRWHVQVMGEGPVALLLHGTGASTHSYDRLAPLLAQDFTVITPDLPGHGFTDLPSYSKLSLPGMAAAVGRLLAEMQARPVVCVGHSAGAAVLLRMEVDGWLEPTRIVSLNGAISPLRGVAGQLFAPIAKMLALWPVVPGLLAWRANDPAVVDELLSRTGSRLRPDSAERYRQLFKSPGHVGGALGMMANWDLESLQRDWPKIRSHVLLVAAALDAMVPADDAQRLLARLPNASAVRLKGLGHLAHEEAPDLIVRLVLAEARGEEPALDPAEGRVLHKPADDRRMSA